MYSEKQTSFFFEYKFVPFGIVFGAVLLLRHWYEKMMSVINRGVSIVVLIEGNLAPSALLAILIFETNSNNNNNSSGAIQHFKKRINCCFTTNEIKSNTSSGGNFRIEFYETKKLVTDEWMMQ
ncbi:hypothetical protein T10_5162 [Trichinella papuae]|uniref:Uncharacterized protein n=1 Tax=Trichinella papuae TaxID=268474 RepID=A0A0V1MAP0_9BILA|nr:hypothetical protein T10_5162 [Trichinella papuae]